MSDGEGALSEWLQRYAPGNAIRPARPAQLVRGDGGTALKLLTTVGIVELHQVSADAPFIAEIGNGRILEIRLTLQQVVERQIAAIEAEPVIKPAAQVYRVPSPEYAPGCP